ncbi:MAG TPA: gamma-glutamyl-gamma-aminobutyrate hydrolase family protein [Pyrinomonadaceae bacterium]|nr:gamma-glutamyl-gamma-aminobutyrate hydrolase family protein [Pyrinomonadaceae bacterium]
MSKESPKGLRHVRPLVGITMRHELETERFYLARFYSEAVEAAGGVPLHISLIPDDAYLEDIVGRLDALLLPGSASDVDPALYGREPHTRLGPVHPLKDATDMLVLKFVEVRRLPLLAICFGMQVWNVFRGGTLIQDIESQVQGALKHEQGAPRERHSHGVKIKPESLCARMAGGENLRVNSHHHQALETIGQNLQATAWSADGLVEAVEDTLKGRWAVGVQWHPEIGWQDDDFSRALFESFIEAARNSASDND